MFGYIRSRSPNLNRLRVGPDKHVQRFDLARAPSTVLRTIGTLVNMHVRHRLYSYLPNAIRIVHIRMRVVSYLYKSTPYINTIDGPQHHLGRNTA